MASRIRGLRESATATTLRTLPYRRHGPATALGIHHAISKRSTATALSFAPRTKTSCCCPNAVNGEYVALHRPVGDMPFCPPEMWIARSPDLIHWGRHEYLFAGAGEWENGRVGAGAPPFAVEDGWLEIYHGNRSPEGRG